MSFSDVLPANDQSADVSVQTNSSIGLYKKAKTAKEGF